MGCAAFGLVDEILITHFEYRRLLGLAPMHHQPLVLAVIAAEVFEFVGISQTVWIDGGKTGEAGIERLAHAMNNVRNRKQQGDQAEKEKIFRQGVDYAA